jgi:hypothetical protein
MSIDHKHLVTGVLLAFVAVTGVTLAVKEIRHARAVAAAETARAATPEPAPAEVIEKTPREPVVLAETAPVPNVSSVPAAPAQAASRAVPEAPVPSPPKSDRPVPAAQKPAIPTAVVPRPASGPATIVVTYFHATARCASCLKIEDLTNATMTTRFAGPIAEKRVVWRVVNIDEPENAHFVKDYGLYTKSVVVSEVKAGREVRWKNLEKVWNLLGDSEAFQGYVEQEVRAFLEKA